MKQQIKDILGLLIIVVPVCVLTFVVWVHSPMYASVQEEQRQAAQLYLTGTYYYNVNEPYTKQALIDRYGFSDEDINPNRILESFNAANSTVECQSKLTFDGYLRCLFGGNME